jgi:ADP-heptose:LPS heptosyltransferase
MNSRLPTRLLCAGLALWYARFGLARRLRPAVPRRILIAHNLLLGDTILLAPLLKKLRTEFPESEIVMTCKPAFVDLFETRPYNVRAMPFDPRNIGSLFALRRERGFDLALLPADNRFSLLARALDSRWVVAFEGDRPAYKNWLVDEFRKFLDHTVALGDLIAERLVDGPAPSPYETADWRAPSAESFSLPSSSYCVLHVGASTPLKQWEPAKWRSLIGHVEASGIRPVISAGPGEEALVAQIDPQSRCISYPGNLSLAHMWRLLAGAAAVVCPDTGVGHLARLAGTPAVILFGPGSAVIFGGGAFWRNMPDRKMTIENFPCRDENIVFRRYLPWAEQCGRGTDQCARRNAAQVASPKCMHALTAEMAIEALDSLLAQTGGRTASPARP